MSGYDRVTYCDVVECCEMCPMYGYDCDGDKRAETPTTDEKHQLSAETPTDLISRADAMAYPLSWGHYDKKNGSREFICGVESYREYIEALPSVDAVSRPSYIKVVGARRAKTAFALWVKEKTMRLRKVRRKNDKGVL